MVLLLVFKPHLGSTYVDSKRGLNTNSNTTNTNITNIHKLKILVMGTPKSCKNVYFGGNHMWKKIFRTIIRTI